MHEPQVGGRHLRERERLRLRLRFLLLEDQRRALYELPEQGFATRGRPGDSDRTAGKGEDGRECREIRGATQIGRIPPQKHTADRMCQIP